MDVFTIPDLISIMGESKLKEALSEFSVKRNPDVQRFIRENAFPYQSNHNARTYIIVDDSYKPKGYFTLSLACMRIPEGISNSLKRKMRGFGRNSASTVPCFLLGQLAREDSTPKGMFSLADIVDMVTGYALHVQEYVGGRFISLDCTDELVSLYESNGFQRINKTDDLNQMIMFIA